VYDASTFSSDFAISRKACVPYSWGLTNAGWYWYGDYQTAGGYVGQLPGLTAYNFYPMWPESDGAAHVAHVALSLLKPIVGLAGAQALELTVRHIDPGTAIAARRVPHAVLKGYREPRSRERD
jgi:hypothetical protein